MEGRCVRTTVSRLFHDASRDAVPEVHALVHRRADTSEVFYDDEEIEGVGEPTHDVEGSGCCLDLIAASQGQGEEDGPTQATKHEQPFEFGACVGSIAQPRP